MLVSDANMRSELGEVRRTLKFMKLMLILTAFILLTASFLLLQASDFLRHGEKMLVDIRQSSISRERHSVNSLPHAPYVQNRVYSQYFESGLKRSGTVEKSHHENKKDHIEPTPLSPQKITKENVMITIKTTQKYHSTRLKLIAQTWFSLAPNQVT